MNIREYILKIALTKSIFQPTMHQIAPSGPAGGPYSASPDTLYSRIKGSLLLREGDKKGVEGGEGEGVDGKGERRKESEGRRPFMDPRYAPAVA